MPYRSNQDTNYVVVRDRKSRRYRNDNDDDDEDDDDYQSDIVSIEEARRYNIRPRVKYYSHDDIDYDYRPERIRMRPVRDRSRFIYDDYDNDRQRIKIVRNRRSPSNIEHRRIKYHSSDRRPIFYERDDGRIINHQPKKTRQTQVVYPDDEPTRMMRKIIIDPRTGHRETIYEKDRSRKHQKYIVEEQPAEIVVDSDDDDDDDDENYVRTKKSRPVIVAKYEKPKKFIKIRSEPTFSKLPTIKNHRRIIYEIPGRKMISNYRY